jgi:tRNA A-37 threonylcarbamoyl transferase component Bud32
MPNVTSLRPDDPRRVGRYRLTGRMDEFSGAGSSAVFLAQRVDGETVMVTLLAADRAADAAARDRFTAEARVARRVPPFCVAKILDAGFEAGRPYLITESVPGATLAQIVALEGPLPPETLRALAIGCATGIASIHHTGLVHGQFGPQMVVLGRDGPRVIHFTITPPYGAATPAADMLAWARTVLFAAVGRASAEPHDLMALPAELRSVVADCLTPDPAGRPLARAVLTELLSGQDLSAGLLAEGSRQARAAARTAVSTVAAPGRQGSRRGHSRAGVWISASAACVLAIAVAAVYIAVRHSPAPAARHRPPAHNRAHLAAPEHAIPAQFAGSWSGTVHQTNPALNVTVQITLAEGTTHGTIGYPQLGCSGKLGLLAQRHGLLTLGLTITSGQSSCVSGKVRLVARPDGDLEFTFLQRSGDQPTGTLDRVF